MALEFEGDLFDGDRGKVMVGILKKKRKNAATPKPKPRRKKEPVVEPLLSAAPYKQRIEDLLLATGWKLWDDEDFQDKWGFCALSVHRQIQGHSRATVRFIRRLARLETMYEKELAAVHAGLIKMVKRKGRGGSPLRVDLRPANEKRVWWKDAKRGL